MTLDTFPTSKICPTSHRCSLFPAAGKFFDSRVSSEKVGKKDKYLGHFLGPVSVILMNSILSNYLNVYYTDVLAISGIWGGVFIGTFPVVAKLLDVLTFIYMGRAVAYTMYSTAHTLLVPLAMHDEEERSRLSLVANTPNMAAGSLIAILFPCLVVPMIGVDRRAWTGVMLAVAAAAFPMVLTEYFYTRERVTEADKGERKEKTVFLRRQFQCCLKSRSWVLGHYNDGYTQALFYTFGQAPTAAVTPVQNTGVQSFMIFA